MMFFQFVGIQFFSIIYMILILIVFLSKKRYESIENSIFKVLLYFTLIELIIDIGVNYTIKYASLFPVFNEVLCKTSIIGYQIWTALLMIYVLLLGNKKKYKNIREGLKNNGLAVTGLLIIFVFAAVVVFLPFEFVYDPKYRISYVSGICSLYTYFVAIIYLVIIILSIIINKNKVSLSKRMPIIIFIMTSAIFLPIQRFNKDVPVLIVPFMSYAIMIMYFTLENPDLKLIEELNDLKDKAEESSNVKNRFLDNISYNTIEPVDEIISVTDNVLKTCDDDKKEDIIRMNLLAKQVKEMLANTMDMSQLESKTLEVNYSNYDLADLIKELYDFNKYHKNDNVEFMLRVNEDLPRHLYGDRNKLYKILNNLLVNAIKYTKVGKVIFSVGGEVIDDKINLHFKVSDTGIGIKEEDKDKLFEKFTTLNYDGYSSKGTGLGLSLAKEMVTLLGGEIVFDSTYQAGTTFYVNITQKVVDGEKIGEINL